MSETTTKNQSRGFRPCGYAKMSEDKITANLMVPVHLVMSKSIAALQPGDKQEVYQQNFLGNGISELELFGHIEVSKSGKGLNIRHRSGALMVMNAQAIESLVDQTREIRTVTISTPDEPWLPRLGEGKR